MKLIILNGTSGAGKTTVARKIHERIPLSVMAPNFEIRRMISSCKNNRDKSREIMFNITFGIAEQALNSGSSVIIDSKIHDDRTGNSIVDRLVAMGKEKGADVYEIILQLDKAGSMSRIQNRGFKKGAILNEDNLEENVDNFLEEMNEFISSRTNAILLDTSTLSPDEVYTEVCKIVNIEK